MSTDPIRFEFTFDEASYIRYSRLIGQTVQDVASRDGSKIEAAIRLIDEQDFTHKATIDFVDNVIDRSSGTIRGRATMPNQDGLFTPGMFGRIQVPGSKPYEALLVPDLAIGSEQVRKFVYVVGDDNVPKQKYVELGQLVDGKRVIKSGLSPDDKIVVNGLMRIRPGQKVTPQEEGAKPPADAKPPEGAKPPEAGKPSEGAKPPEAGKPSEGAKTEGAKTEGGKPAEGAKSETDAKPAPGAKPAAAAKPAAGAAPASAASN